jgi:hypothetical protein
MNKKKELKKSNHKAAKIDIPAAEKNLNDFSFYDASF